MAKISQVSPQTAPTLSVSVVTEYTAGATDRIVQTPTAPTDPLAVSTSPLVDGEQQSPRDIENRLSVLGLTYLVAYHKGPWHKGCCFRPMVQKVVLKNISMHIKSGTVTALLGSSGSGKTSLLDCIASRTQYPTQVVGGIYINSRLMNKYIFREVGGYVMQDDLLLPNLTVRETLMYTGKLKFVVRKRKEQLYQRVQHTLELMNLTAVADSPIGGRIKRGISGGEKRRLSVAIQLLQDPKILLLDEPTTGLDSFTAYYLIRRIYDLARTHHKIILMTIHQPRSDIVRMFGNVGIMSKGEMVYLGPAAKLVPYFTSLGFPCPTYANPLDHYVDLASIDHRGAAYEEMSEARVNDLKMAFILSDTFRTNLTDIHDVTRLPDAVVDNTPALSYLEVAIRPQGFLYLVYVLWRRFNLNLLRDRVANVIRLLQACLLFPFLWVFVYRLKDNQQSIQDRNGLLYQVVQSTAYLGLLNAVALFPPLREAYRREHRDGLYGPISFLLSYFLHILPYSFISSLLFSCCLYWTVGFQSGADRFGVFFTVMFLLQAFGETLAIFFLGIFKTVSIANSATALVLALAGMISSGFLRSNDDLFEFFKRFSDVNIFKYASEILVINEFRGLKLSSCSRPESVLNDSSAYITANATTTQMYPCQFVSGDDYLRLYYPGVQYDLDLPFGILVLYVLLFKMATIALYKYLARTR